MQRTGASLAILYDRYCFCFRKVRLDMQRLSASVAADERLAAGKKQYEML
jgi:hypothetical protein